MAVDCINDKLSIKNLLFTKAMPNYVTSVPTNGHKLYPCTDCGDKFILESSYEDHISRKSLRITYMCRHCNKLKIFYNRCNLLCHIRSHSFKTATINVTDLKIEPLPLSHLKMNLVSSPNNTTINTSKKTAAESSQNASVYTCTECKNDIPSTGIAYKDRKNHFMQYTNEVYTCPICLFALPTECGLKAHMRIHLKHPPYYCPECGIHLPNKSVNYPYNHDCEGFKMMRATARLKCPVSKCQLFHPNNFIEHMKVNHLKKVYKCPFCVVACFNESTMAKHLNIHATDIKAMVFYQCELCPGRLVLQNHMDHHLKGHVNVHVFPCWVCNVICKSVSTLISHHFNKHHSPSSNINKLLLSIINDYTQIKPLKPQTGKQTLYRVVKKCDQCKRSFIYKCKQREIHVLPNACPYKCSSNMQSNIETIDSDTVSNQIICHLCKIEISQDWEDIKTHYATHHKNYRCLDAKIELERIDVGKYLSHKKMKQNKDAAKHLKKLSKKMRKPQQCNKFIDIIDEPEPAISTSSAVNDELTCNKCGWHCENKKALECHMISHRDPCMAYQCLECGQSFVVKPSFSTHLLLEHNIADVEDYIKEKQCYNENALSKYQPDDDTDEPLCDNQCSICREQFDDTEGLEKHFRVHGMAFLKKNTSNKTTN